MRGRSWYTCAVDSLLVNGTWLEENLGEVALLDVREAAEYEKGHIPGAIHFNIWEYHWFDTSPDGIRKFDAWMGEGLARAGLSADRTTVIYEDFSGMNAARMAWVLLYFSFKSVRILDGGLREWLRCGYELETAVHTSNPAAAAHYETRPELLATLDEVRQASTAAARLIDCRTPAEYQGTHVRAKRGGHVPGSGNIEWKKNLTADGYFLPPGELRDVYKDLAHALDQPVIAYCHGGFRSAHTFLVLRMLGFKDVRNYLGSWGEWGNREDVPVE